MKWVLIMLKVHYNLTEITNTHYLRKMVLLERKLFKNTLEELYQFDHNLKFTLLIDNEDVIGFLLYKEHEIAYDIYKVAIKEEYRGKGLAKDLIKDLFTKDIVLEVNLENIEGVKLYESLGFTKYANLQGYYDGKDGVKMIRSFNG